MKTIIRILIIAEFALIIFVPGVYMSRLLLIPLFLSMGALVVLYWFAMFWVSKKDVAKVLGKQPDVDFFVGKLPADPTADLSRGRLCSVDGRLVLMKRVDGKERATTPCKEDWTLDIDTITSVGFGKVLPARKGFILYINDDEVSFTYSKAAKNKEMIYKAIGWKMPEQG